MNDTHNDIAVVCPHCAASTTEAQWSASRRTCPNCGGALQRAEPIPWTDVARVANLAEAGFLVDELVGMGIDARVHQLDDFNALYDRWTSQYLIRVPTDSAAEAAAQIQQYRDDDERRNQSNEQAAPASLSSQLMDPRTWRPVALVVLTGMASFLAGQRLSGQNAVRRMPSDSLPSAVNQIGRPFVTEPVPGQPRFRLSFDSRRQAWTLDTDRDNDGSFDSRRQFRATGAAW